MPKGQANTKPTPNKPASAAGGAKTPAKAGPSLAEPAATADHEYALISVLYHALQGVQTTEEYIADAEAAKDDELVQFFIESRDEQAERANRAKALLVSRLETEDDDSDEDEDEDDDEEEEEE